MQNKSYKIIGREDLIENQNLEDLMCCVCQDLLFLPVKFDCGKHIMCQMCIVDQNYCPICRCQITFVKPDKKIKEQLDNLIVVCPLKCGSINYHEIYSHILSCKNQNQYSKYCSKILELTKEQMISILDKEITPHLKEKHEEIFINFVDNWKWLSYLNKDWKWWWWSKTAWWANKICEKCNFVWHKYEDEIEQYEKIRIHFIKQL